MLLDRALRLKDRTALVAMPGAEGPGEAISYAALYEDAQRLAAGLQRRLNLGDRALMIFPNDADFVRLFCACLLAGIVAVPAALPRNARGLEKLDALARTAGAGIVLIADSLAPVFARLRQTVPLPADAPPWVPASAIEPLPGFVPPDIGPNMTAVLQFTSGSTGTQKGVMVRHRNILANVECLATVCGRGEDLRLANWMPFFHDWGLFGNLLFPLYAEGTCWFFDPADFLRRPRRWIEVIAENRCSVACGPDFAYKLAAGAAADGPALDLSAWRLAMLGAEPIRAATLDAFAAAWAPHGFRAEALYPSYGLAENTLIATGGPPGLRWRQSDLNGRAFMNCGGAINAQRLAVVDPATGLPQPEGEPGELWIQGDCVAGGYWRNPEATEATFRARLPGEDGEWLRTGDMAFLKAGELHVCGRLKDVIIKGGQNHLAEDIEMTMEAADPALRPGCGAAFGVEAAGAERLILVHEVNYGPKPDLNRVLGAIQRAVAQTHGVMADAIAILPPGKLEKTSSGKIRRAHTRAAFEAGELAPLLEWRGWG